MENVHCLAIRKAPATPGVLAPNTGREKERKRKNLWIAVSTWINCSLIREPLGRS
jgi:hypothetical protein